MIGGCNNSSDEHSAIDDDAINMAVAKESITVESATFSLTNNTDEAYLTGEDFTIQEKGGLFGWKNLPVKKTGFSDVGITIPANGTIELFVEWEGYYGDLNPGTYRLIKTYNVRGEKNAERLFAEFTV
jgi:hypothetical protein